MAAGYNACIRWGSDLDRSGIRPVVRRTIESMELLDTIDTRRHDTLAIIDAANGFGSLSEAEADEHFGPWEYAGLEDAQHPLSALLPEGHNATCVVRDLDGGLNFLWQEESTSEHWLIGPLYREHLRDIEEVERTARRRPWLAGRQGHPYVARRTRHSLGRPTRGPRSRRGLLVAWIFSWGNKWGNMPHRFQPISADLDSAKTALESALRSPADLKAKAHNPKVAGSNPAPAIGRKARKCGPFSFVVLQTTGCKIGLWGKRWGKVGSERGRFRPLRRGLRSTYFAAKNCNVPALAQHPGTWRGRQSSGARAG
jgi:hypothetical protein